MLKIQFVVQKREANQVIKYCDATVLWYSPQILKLLEGIIVNSEIKHKLV